jgi:hypothetical protein
MGISDVCLRLFPCSDGVGVFRELTLGFGYKFY